MLDSPCEDCYKFLYAAFLDLEWVLVDVEVVTMGCICSTHIGWNGWSQWYSTPKQFKVQLRLLAKKHQPNYKVPRSKYVSRYLCYNHGPICDVWMVELADQTTPLMVCLVLHGTQSHEVETRTTQDQLHQVCCFCQRAPRPRTFPCRALLLAPSINHSPACETIYLVAWDPDPAELCRLAGSEVRRQKRKEEGSWSLDAGAKLHSHDGGSEGLTGAAVSSLVTRRGGLCAGVIRCATELQIKGRNWRGRGRWDAETVQMSAVDVTIYSWAPTSTSTRQGSRGRGPLLTVA